MHLIPTIINVFLSASPIYSIPLCPPSLSLSLSNTTFSLHRRALFTGQIPTLPPINHIQPICSTSNPPNRHTQQLLHAQHIPLGIHRKVLKVPCLGNVLGPSRHRLINHLDLRHGFQTTRHGIQNLPLVFIRPPDLHLGQSREDVQLGQIQRGEPINERGILHLGNVEPSHPSRSPGGRAPLGPHDAEVLADGTGYLALELGGEGSLAHARAIRLGGAVNPVDLLGTHAQSGEHRSDGGVARRHVGVRSEIDVEHGGVGALDENFFPRVVRVVGVLDGIGGHGADLGSDGFVVRQLTVDVDFQSGKGAHVRGREFAEAHFEEVKVLEVADANAVAADFGSVGRTDALLGGPDLVPPELVFVEPVDLLVEVEDEVGAVGDEDAAFGVDSRLEESVELVEEGGEVDDDAVADDAGGLLVEDAGGEEVEFVLLALDDDGVSGVGSSGDTGADVVFLRQHIDQLSLPLVAPLTPQYDVYAGFCIFPTTCRRRGGGFGIVGVFVGGGGGSGDSEGLLDGFHPILNVTQHPHNTFGTSILLFCSIAVCHVRNPISFLIVIVVVVGLLLLLKHHGGTSRGYHRRSSRRGGCGRSEARCSLEEGCLKHDMIYVLIYLSNIFVGG
mmetsp:Transcript_23520/g.49756  ORF Transcript_23520/g.49756 Transcript_23520/m.49756 type:complete len:616 (-) Transcript_23520:291-2138(-)